jgi:hypothetical protein
MKFLVIVKANEDSEAGVLPNDEILAQMGKFNEELSKAGVLLDLNGLKPSKHGARVRFSGKSRTVVDGPFPETKELIAGYWLLQCKSREECVEWIKRSPMQEGELEIRQLFELSDFEMTPETRALHDRLAEQVQKQ